MAAREIGTERIEDATIVRRVFAARFVRQRDGARLFGRKRERVALPGRAGPRMRQHIRFEPPGRRGVIGRSAQGAQLRVFPASVQRRAGAEARTDEDADDPHAHDQPSGFASTAEAMKARHRGVSGANAKKSSTRRSPVASNLAKEFMRRAIPSYPDFAFSHADWNSSADIVE